MYAQVEKPKENRNSKIANCVALKKGYVKQGFGFVDIRPESVAQCKLQEMDNNSYQASLLRGAKDAGSIGEKNIYSTGLRTLSSTVLQRKILVGDIWENHTDESLVNDIKADVRTRLNNWSELKEKIFKRRTNGETNTAVIKYYNENVDGINVTKFEADILASLRKHNERTSFADRKDLYRQVTQDVKLILLGFHNVAGVSHHDGQFKRTDDGFGGAASGRNKKLAIYRTMNKADWLNYNQSNNLNDILHGHGGSLGQAMYYLYKSKKDRKDDVLVEFKFSDNASKLVDYTRVNGDGEGGDPHNDKLTGKSERNDIMGADQDVFSINLSKSKDLIKMLNPVVRLVETAL